VNLDVDKIKVKIKIRKIYPNENNGKKVIKSL